MTLCEDPEILLNKEFTHEKMSRLLKESVLKELVSQGNTVFEYSFGILYITTQGKKKKASLQTSEAEILSLIHDLGELTNQVFTLSNPQLKISTPFCRAVAFDKPITKNIMLYLDIEDWSRIRK